ncbi:MAG TPA: hypothetical protein VJH96_01300 [Patescibacteria group bacterium]|nr:hypothetical protein [Patescibacteria group bacterium]
MNRLIRLLKIIDDYFLLALLVVFIFFIPLYPKLPLKKIEYTYIAIRLEDIYITLLSVVFVLQLIRRKIVLNTKLLIPILLFWAAVFTSFIYGTYWGKTIDLPHLSLLHSLRRVEYMVVFFIAASSIRSKRDFTILLYSLFFSFFLVNIYGLGQRFLNFPAVSTMNPEFARGHILYLTAEARVQSTFAGHYDLASYIVFLIPIALGLLFTLQNKFRFFVFFTVLISIVVLIFTVSRIGFIAYLASTGLFLLSFRKIRYLILIMLFTAAIVFSNNDLAKRFKKTVQIKQILVNEQTGEVFVPQQTNTKDLPSGTSYVEIKKPQQKVIAKAIPKTTAPGAFETATFKKQIATETVAKETSKTKKILSASEEAKLIASISALLKPIFGVVYDISFSTRLQAEWPRAIAAFLQNPILGKGPSTITEATDNDYLRWLGEFGLLGFVTFMGVLIIIIRFIIIHTKKIEKHRRIVFYSLIFSILGLLVIASYIDVFEASKVAFVIWYTIGIYYGALSLHYAKQQEKKQEKK